MSAATLIPLPSVRPASQAHRLTLEPARRRPAASPAGQAAPLPRAVRHLVVAGLLAVVAALALGVAIALSGFLAGPVAGGSVVVQPGQSLWEVAAQTGSGDVSQTVADIARLNGLTDSTIQAGQTLVLPAH